MTTSTGGARREILAERHIPGMDGAHTWSAGEQDSVVEAVLSAGRVLVDVVIRSLTEVSDDVTLTQYRSLSALCALGPQGVGTLADAVGVTHSAESRLCDHLVRKGLVHRAEDDHDRRAVRLAPTEAGRRLVDAVAARRRAEIARLLEATPPEDGRLVAVSLQKLTAAAGKMPGEDRPTGRDA